MTRFVVIPVKELPKIVTNIVKRIKKPVICPASGIACPATWSKPCPAKCALWFPVIQAPSKKEPHVTRVG